MKLGKLYTIIEERKKRMPKDSYVASLFAGSKDRIIQKIGEEATEVIIAAKNNGRRKLISELADLWFRLLILMVDKNITLEDIEIELEKRNARK